MTQEKWQDTLISIKHKVCTARNAKIAAAFCVVCVLATAGGHYYLYRQHTARHAERVEPRPNNATSPSSAKTKPVPPQPRPSARTKATWISKKWPSSI